jgi:hypothetical protein
MTELLDRVAAPFKSFAQWQRLRDIAAAERAEAEAETQRERRLTQLARMAEDYADAERLALRSYRDLSAGEAKVAKAPAADYFGRTGTVRLYHLLPLAQLRQASLVRAYAAQVDREADGDVGEIHDVRPRDAVTVDRGVVYLGPVPELEHAHGTRWRFFIELSYSVDGGRSRRGFRTKRFVIDYTL